MSVFEDTSDKILDQFDCANSLEVCNLDALLATDVWPAKNYSNPSPDSVLSTIGEIENFLMNDDEYCPDLQSSQELCNNFFADVLVDSPAVDKLYSDHGNATYGEKGGSERVSENDDNVDKLSTCSDHGNATSSGKGGSEKVNENEDNDGGEAATPDPEDPDNEDNDVGEAGTPDPDDPVSKKRIRQLRNRDAAVRSRERRKMYVRDLELKSKYLEGECRRLGRMLQCFVAENQALRHSLQAFGVSSAKQESAVLLLESLLLGSLLWFLGIMCLFTLPPSTLVPFPPENEGGKVAKNVNLRGAGSDNVTWSEIPAFENSRRCKASRKRMRLGSHFLVV